MPLKSKSQFDSLLAVTALLSNEELHALADKCQNLIADHERIEREELKQKLMANLQQAISAILGNGFYLTIENCERNAYGSHEDVWFCPDEHCNIKIE